MARFLLTAQLQLRAPSNTRQVVSQMQRQLRGVNVNVNVRTAAASRQVNTLNSATQKLNKSGANIGKTFAVSLRRFAAFSIATRAVTLFSNKLSAGIEDAIQFERELVKISQVTGKTITQLNGLSSTITRLSTSLGTSSKSLLSTGRILAQAGIQAKDLDTALDALAKTTLAPTFDDITKTAEGAVAILAQFGKGVGALKEQLGAINAVAGQFAVESGDLISAVRRTGGVFKSAGGELNELIGLFTSVRATTRESAESIATGLRTIFTRIQRPKTIEFLKQFGVELTDLNGKFVGPFEAVKRLSAAFKGLEEGDITFVRVAEELGGFRQIGKVIPLIQQFEVAERARAAAVKGANSLDRDAATAQQALAVQFEKTRERFLALIRDIAGSNSIQTLVRSTLSLAESLTKVLEALKPIIPLLGAMAGVKLAGVLGAGARGLGGALARRNAGGPIGLNRGGMVPGTGNTDTVPAMLTSGEFVIRKNSVRKIGADNLARMNATGFAAGGQVVRGRHGYGPQSPTLREAVAARKKQAVADPTKTITGGKKGVGTMTPLTSAQRKAELKASKFADEDIYAAAFLTPEGRDQQYKGFIKKDNLQKAIRASLPAGMVNFTKSKKKGQLTGANYQAVAEKYARRNTFRIDAGSLEKVAANKLEDTLLDGVVSTTRKGAKQINNSLGIQGTENIADALKSSNIDQVMGNLFELVLTNAGAPFGVPDTDPPNAPFDFPQGLGSSIAKQFGIGSKSKTDAKSFFSTPNLASMNKKVQNELANETIKELTPIFKELQVSEKRATATLNSGGPTPKSDVVPAMLTPGEFVINKGAAKQIGMGNLNRMNKHGVAGFAAGGVVRSGRNNYGSDAGMGMQIRTPGGGSISAGASNASISSAMGTKDATQASTKAINDQTKATEKLTKGHNDQEKKIKSNNAGMKTMGLVMAASMIPRFEDADSGIKAAANSMLDLSMQVGVVMMALDAFGVKLNFSGANPGMSKKGFGQSGGFSQRGMAVRGQAGGTRFGNFASDKLKLKEGGKLRGGITKGFAKSGRAAGAVTGGILNPASGAGAITGAIGPIVAVAAAAGALGMAMDALSGVHKEAEVAIRSGNAARAEDTALASANAKSSTMMAAGGAAAAAAIAALAGATLPVVAIIGGVAAAGLLLMKAFNALDPAVEKFRNFMVLFGGASSETIKAQAASKATIVAEEKTRKKANIALAASMKRGDRAGAAQAAKDIAASGDREAKARMKALQKEEADAMRAASGGGFMGLGGDGGLKEVQAKIAEEQEKERTRRGAGLGNVMQLNQDRIKRAGARGQVLDADALAADFDINLSQAGEAGVQFRKDVIAMAKAAKTNADQLKALNFGLAGASAAAQGAASELDRFLASRETGTFDATSILEQALTSSAGSLNPRDLARAQGQLGASMRSVGATDAQIAESTQSIGALAKVQQVGESIFKRVASTAEERGRGGPQEILEDFRQQLRSQLGGVPKAIQDKVLTGITKPDGDALTDALDSQDFSKVFQGSLDAVKTSLKDGAIGIQKTNQENNKKLAGLYKERIANESQFIEAQKKSIQLQSEAAELIAEFSGKEFTTQQKTGFAEREARAGLGAGADLSASGLIARSRLASQQVIAGRQVLSRPSFSDPRQAAVAAGQVQNAEGDQQEILKFARDRIKIYKDEISAAKDKLKLDQEAAKAALSGDQQGQFEATLASIAASAFRSGNAGLLGQIEGDARLKGFESLSDSEKKASEGTLKALGLSSSLAESLAESTPELDKLQSAAAQTAQVIAEVGKNLESIAKGKFDQTTMDIKQATIRIGQSVQRQNQPQQFRGQGSPAPQTRSRGGIIYASNGMFVPRGTDTVPAMLTPGEFVVNRAAVQRGNNLQVLRAMNNSGSSAGEGAAYMNAGGPVRYRNGGSSGPEAGGGMFGGFSESITKFTNSLSSFSTSVEKLIGFEFKLKLDPVNITVSINEGSLKKDVKDQVLMAVVDEIQINQLGQLEKKA